MVSVGMLLPMAEGLTTSGAFLRDFVGTVEAAGIESVWAVEHVIVAEDYEPNYPYSADGHMPGGKGAVPLIPDPLELLSFAAAWSTELLLGTCVVVAPLHPPALLAKRAATIDRLSDGRLLLGLGIGWQREEYAAVGVPFRDRGGRLDECIGAMRALWADVPASYAGRHVAFDRVHSLPRPTRGTIPILLGGNSDPALRRAGAVADGWVPFTLSPAGFTERRSFLAQAAEAAERSIDDIEITVWPGSHDPARDLDPVLAKEYLAGGADRVLLRPPVTTPDLTGLAETIERYRSALD